MKIKYYTKFIIGIVFIIMVVYTFWQIGTPKAAVGNTISNSQPISRSLISMAHPELRSFKYKVHWIGIVESQNFVELTALMAGRVEAIDAEDQNPIENGQSVIRLGGPQIGDNRARLTAQIESLKKQAQLARETLIRLEKNLKTRLATKDQVAAAQETKIRLEAQLCDVQLNLKILNRQCRIVAPINGIFTNRRVSVGQNLAAGQVIGDIIDTTRLRIKASLFPSQGIELQGRKAVIRLNENQTLTGIVKKVLPRASCTGAVTVWIESPQIDVQLRPGQTVGGDIMTESTSKSLSVPKSAIVYDSQDNPFLFISKNKSFERLSIQTGMEQDGWIRILSGLKEDQLVVVRGAYELFYQKFNEQFKVQD